MSLLAEAARLVPPMISPARECGRRPWKGRYTGQRQKWFAFRFEGNDEIRHPFFIRRAATRPNSTPGAGSACDRLPDLIIPFKRPVYERVVKEFSSLAGMIEIACRPEKPYRPNVGIALFNADGRLLIGRRFRDDGPEIILPGLEWQMPQGGVDEGEDHRAAAFRELWEETSVRSADYLGETDWLTYEFPPFDGPRIGWQNSAASARNGSRCASPALRRRSIH